MYTVIVVWDTDPRSVIFVSLKFHHHVNYRDQLRASHWG